MESTAYSLQLGVLSQSQINLISDLAINSHCFCLHVNHSQAFGASSHRILLQLRRDFVVQIDLITKAIISGFKCDYQISFEIGRSTNNKPNQLGTPQRLDFVFNLQNKRRVSLLVQDAGSLENFCKKLQKQYIVQLGFHQNFRGIKILGKGQSATVYKALSFRDQKQVAIKSFKRSIYFETPNGKITFQKQFKVLTQLQHKNICGFQSVYETQNTTYIVMQNLALSLFGWIQKYGFPSFEQGKKIIYQLLQGIQYLHSLGIMHRDLKLQNIMVRKDVKKNVEIVIVDLGLAQYTNCEKFIYPRCGTPGYVAPQILKYKNQSQKYNQYCDIFSLGVIFHILFLKKSIFEGNDVNQVLKKNRECTIDFTHEHFNNLDKDAINLMKRMLQKDPNHRISASKALNHPYFDQKLKISTTLESIKDLVC